MATRTQGGAKTRQMLSRMDKQFSDDKKIRQYTVRSCQSPDMEIASLREELNNSNTANGIRVDPNRLGFMQPCNRQKIAHEIEVAHGNKFHWRTNKKDRLELQERIKRTYVDVEGKYSKEIAAYREFEINSEINSLPFALGAFQSINLSADDLPLMITPRGAKQHFDVRWVGQDGTARMNQWRHARNAELIDMRMVTTDKIEYQLFDLHHGDVNHFDEINAQLREDLEWHIEDLALESLLANQMTTGIKDLITLHRSVDPANIPDGNYLDLTNVGTYGAANTFTLARLKAILNHLAQWGFGFGPDGAITIRQMLMSPQNARDSWDYVDLVSGWDSAGSGVLPVDPHDTVPTGVREQIWNSGALLNSAWGYTWQTQFNPRISKGRLYVLTNLPVGWYFTKSEFDRVIEWKDQPDNLEQNYGLIVMQKALSFYQPVIWAYRYLIVDF